MVLCVAILLSCVYQIAPDHFKTGASDSLPVHNLDTSLNYTSIQSAIDAPETVDGHTILVDAGTYFEHVVIGKSLVLVGECRNETAIDGLGAGTVVHVVSNYVILKGFGVRNAQSGVFLDHSENSVVEENSVTGITETYAIYASYCRNLTIERNIVGPNDVSGILVTNSIDFTVTRNNVFSNGAREGYGLNANASAKGLIAWNNAYNNSYDGIGLGRGCNNCTVVGNNVSANRIWGIWLDSDSTGNLLYRNNIVDNGGQVSVNLANHWDNGLEGNYWTDNVGPDVNKDGIVDQPFVINGNNYDNYPLDGMFLPFETNYGYQVDIMSNSSIRGFKYIESNGTVRFEVSSAFMPVGYGFCRVSIPHGLTAELYNVTVDGSIPLFVNYSIFDDGDKRWIYFLYQSSEHEVLIYGIDRTIPSIYVLDPQNKTYYSDHIQLRIFVSDLVSWLAFSLDGQDNVTISGNSTMIVTSNGEHFVIVYARDNAENTGFSAAVHFEVTIGTGTAGNPFLGWIVLAVVVVSLVVALVLLYLRRSRWKSRTSDH